MGVVTKINPRQQEEATMRIGFLNLLTVVFVVLKLTGVIAWSWWFVTAPTILSALIFLGVITLYALVTSR